ncbi:hypothetical protein CLOM_g757 [Closterium sp. NIES-68]|nr:hypothetical protein CLOM_g757 [Closterium sp. NIES-68]GJP79879.1 hypothetical protein CLOP_g10096 [Closterium sp. NIES-67]
MRSLFYLLLALLLIAQPFAKQASFLSRAHDTDEESYTVGDDDEPEEADDSEIPEGDDGDVVALTDTTFPQVLKDNKHVLLEFYAPWCGHCKSLAPEYKVAAAKLKEFGVVLAKVDATKYADLSEKYNVEGFPTIVFVSNGETKPFNGGRTSADIVSWVKKKIGMGVSTFTAADVAKAAPLLESSTAVSVGFFASSDAPEAVAFSDAAKEIDGVEFVLTSDADVAAAFGLAKDKKPTIAIVKKEEEKFVTFDGEYTKEAIAAFVTANKLPLLITFSEETSASIFAGDIKKQVMLFATHEEYTKIVPAVAAAAKQFKGELVFVYINGSDTESQPVHEYFGTEAKETTVMGFFMGDEEDPSSAAGGLKYRMKEPVTETNIKAFAKSFIDGDLKPFHKSEPIPEKNDGPVTVVVGESFEKIVLDETKDVLLEVYAPWCGHCKSLEPTYKKLGKRFASVESVVIAKMDGTANEYPGLEVEGFPTIFFYPANKKSDPVKVQATKLKQFIKVIVENAAIKFELPAKEKDSAAAAAAENKEALQDKAEEAAASSGEGFKDEL